MVWRCVSRLDYGTKYCHESPSLDEKRLQKAILTALSSVMSQKDTLIGRITGAMEVELAPVPNKSLSLADIEQRLDEISAETRKIVAKVAQEGSSENYTDRLKALVDEAATLKKERTDIQARDQTNSQALQRMEDVATVLAQETVELTQWDESLIRQLVDTVKVISAEKIVVCLRGGMEIEQDML